MIHGITYPRYFGKENKNKKRKINLRGGGGTFKAIWVCFKAFVLLSLVIGGVRE